MLLVLVYRLLRNENKFSLSLSPRRRRRRRRRTLLGLHRYSISNSHERCICKRDSGECDCFADNFTFKIQFKKKQ